MGDPGVFFWQVVIATFVIFTYFAYFLPDHFAFVEQHAPPHITYVLPFALGYIFSYYNQGGVHKFFSVILSAIVIIALLDMVSGGSQVRNWFELMTTSVKGPSDAANQVRPLAQQEAERKRQLAEQIPPPAQPANRQASLSSLVCGRPVEYTVDRAGSDNGFLGVWTGTWNNPGRLCGALIVENINANGIANIIYVYGASRPGSRLEWKRQRLTGLLSGGETVIPG